MPAEKIIITIFAKDRPGIIQALSDIVLSHRGNWLESSLSRLCGQFTGIAHISIEQQQKTDLVDALKALENDGIHVTFQNSSGIDTEGDEIESIQMLVEANDRPGIVEEITSALSDVNVNVEHMDTECESASMAGYELFKAEIDVTLPKRFTIIKLQALLEKVSDDLMVTIK